MSMHSPSDDHPNAPPLSQEDWFRVKAHMQGLRKRRFAESLQSQQEDLELEQIEQEREELRRSV